MKPTKQIIIEGYTLLPDFMADYGYRYSPIRTPLTLDGDLVRRLIAADLGISVYEVIYVDGEMLEPVQLTAENCEMLYSEIRNAMGNPLDVEFLTEANTGGASTFEEAPAQEEAAPIQEEVPAQEAPQEEAVETPAQEEAPAPQEPVEKPAKAKDKKDK